ncbi:MAG: ExbD/TolR family protein [Candidatus Marinarcus sp.]|uniref:ExbD/TolR family protein n=1 Tax=Candidatus Marinarcus sp. TaxID=3100987 RepID=UPI003B00A6A1
MRKKREIIIPDITPLIDVVFILLIFFIVSSVFKKNEFALVLNLPTSSAKEIELKQKEIIIEINSKKIAFMGKEITLNELEKQLFEINEKDKMIIFKIDKEVQYKHIVDVLDILQKNQLFNISLVTEKKNN